MGGRIIALAGKKGTGKDTLAEKVYDLLPTCKAWMRFSDPMNIELSRKFRIQEKHLTTSGTHKDITLSPILWQDIPKDLAETFKDNGYHDIYLTIREAQQIYGNNYYKSLFGDDVWLKQTRKVVSDIKFLNPDANIIFSDLRFDYEYNYIKYIGGTIIKLESKKEHYDTHSSENSLTKWDHVVKTVGYNDEETSLSNLLWTLGLLKSESTSA